MGGTARSIGLELMAGAPGAARVRVREWMIRFLVEAWANALPPAAFRAARDWIDLGDDSVLTVGDYRYGDSEDVQPETELTFWFYGGAEWPSELAAHWLALALFDQRIGLLGRLALLGYRVRDDATWPDELRGRFVADGERIGLVDDEGVLWQLPEASRTGWAELPRSLRIEAAAVREGFGLCGCPYCEGLRLRASEGTGIEPPEA